VNSAVYSKTIPLDDLAKVVLPAQEKLLALIEF